ncbi:hypothetical protein LbDm2_1197 [Levilactobacillus brevis]|uniref:hypothetical protein n=1 Tax=Levilactobacillus brevis TaxID=1580 RepID=UPI00057F41BC|nr:hypothetical protein [Levilactobacillus brevis]KID43898.1 hypothetical protein LbDm2_1197 [Levilactobacillus brevis]
MTYLVEFKLIRFSLKRLRTETLTIRFKEEGSGYSILAKAYSLTKDGWDREASSEIDVSDDTGHIGGKWWLDAVLRIPGS